MIKDLIKQNRSIRRFHEDHKIEKETLKELVNLARMSASAANRQPLKYMLFCDPEKNEEIFSCLAWAAYLKDWSGPAPGERPSAYIIILGDTTIASNYWCDHGIAAQSMTLGAREKGLGGCLLGAINKKKMIKAINLDPKYEILLVLAIGKPDEEVILETVGNEGNIRYWRDENDVHHVPKRKLEDIILN